MSIRFCKYFFGILTVVFCFGCQSNDTVKNDDILAEVGTKKLLKSDISKADWNRLIESDSAGLIQLYINRWVDNQILLEAAEDKLSNKEKDKSKLIEDYRTSLLIFEYQQKLIREKLDTAITKTEIDSFYNNNLSNFQLKKNIVKIRYVKIAKSNSNLNKLVKMIQSPNQNNDSLLRIIAEKEAENFYIDDNWLFLDDIIKEIPLDEDYNQQRFLSSNKFISLEENGILYLLYILDYRIKNTASPLEFEKDKIRDILIYQRKLKFLKSTQYLLVEKAKKNGHVKIYTPIK